jgi:hypothetical protein
MKSHSQSRNLSGRPTPLTPAQLGLPAVYASQATGCELRLTNHASLLSNQNPLNTQFLSDSTAMRDCRNPLKPHPLFFSNRSKIGCLRACFAGVLHEANRPSQLTAPAFRIATEELEIRLTCSQQTRKLFLIASFFAVSHLRHRDRGLDRSEKSRGVQATGR